MDEFETPQIEGGRMLPGENAKSTLIQSATERILRNGRTSSAGILAVLYAIWDRAGQPGPKEILDYIGGMDNVKFFGLLALAAVCIFAKDR